MKDRSKNNTSIRWGELYPALAVFAEVVGKSKSDIAREAVRNHLREKGMDVPERANPKEVDYAREILTVRWAGLLEPLTDRAIIEKVSVAEIARRAVRLYLANGEVPKILQFIGELRKAHADMARIGGNLNRIARLINADGILAKTDLGQVHLALIEEFKIIAELYGRVEKELERQRP